MKKTLFFLSIILLLSGCQTTIKASQYSVLDPDVNFYLDTPIVVDTFEENDLSSKFYIKTVIQELQKRGFTQVYSRRELNDQGVVALAAAYIKLDQKYDSYTYESADYGMVDSGYSTTTCTGFGVTATCNTSNQKVLGVTGSSTKTGTMVHHFFTLHYYDLVTKDKVLFAMGSTFNEKCNSDFLYDFLIGETISRANFIKPEDYSYKVKLPDGVKCK